MPAKLVFVAWIGACAALAGCGSAEDSAVPDTPAAQTPAPPPRAPDVPAETTIAAVELLEHSLAYGETEDSNLIGYLAMPADAIEPLPGIVVIHEWRGLDDGIKSTTRRLAAEGYVALAVDLYAGATAGTPAEAEALMAAVLERPDNTLSNIRQAYDYLSRHAFAPSVALVGWRLGGTWALRTALALPGELDALVVYYGEVVTDREQLRRLDMPILGFFAELDESIPVGDVELFRTGLREFGLEPEIYVYSRVGHAFASPGSGAYDGAAAERAWTRTIEFLQKSL